MIWDARTPQLRFRQSKLWVDWRATIQRFFPRCREDYVCTEAPSGRLKRKEVIEQSSFAGLGIYQGPWPSF